MRDWHALRPIMGGRRVSGYSGHHGAIDSKFLRIGEDMSGPPPSSSDTDADGAPRDAVYFRQLARQARKIASGHSDPDVARRLREIAVRHEHRASQLKRNEVGTAASRPSALVRKVMALLRGRS